MSVKLVAAVLLLLVGLVVARGSAPADEKKNEGAKQAAQAADTGRQTVEG